MVAVEKRTIIPLPGIEPQLYSPWPVAMVTELSQLLNIWVLFRIHLRLKVLESKWREETQLRFDKVHCVDLELKEEKADTGGRIQEAIWYFEVRNYPYETVTDTGCMMCCSPSTSVISSVGMVPLEDLYQLNQYLQVRKISSAYTDSATCRTYMIYSCFFTMNPSSRWSSNDA